MTARLEPDSSAPPERDTPMDNSRGGQQARIASCAWALIFLLALTLSIACSGSDGGPDSRPVDSSSAEATSDSADAPSADPTPDRATDATTPEEPPGNYFSVRRRSLRGDGGYM